MAPQSSLPPLRRRQELRAIEKLYQASFVALGVKMVAESLDLWGDVPTSQAQISRAIDRYLDQVLKVAGLRREQLRRVTFAYYRLTRALWTGYTIQEIRVEGGGRIVSEEEATKTDLDKLRGDFYNLVGSLTPEVLDKTPASSGNDEVEVEVLKDLEDALNEVDGRLHGQAGNNIIGIVEKMERDLKKSDRSRPARVVDTEEEDLHRLAGSKATAQAHKSVLDGAREDSSILQGSDDRVLGYVRVSETGTPCGWCAMLISRGLVFKYGKFKLNLKTLYNSERSASKDAGNSDFHPNCHCRAVAVYSQEQFDNDPMFDLNRQYAHEWPSVTAGLGGKQALSKWRKHIRNASA